MLLFFLITTSFCLSANGWNVKSHLSTMTPYKYSSNGAEVPYPAPPMCRQVYIDAVFRHGSRYPTTGSTRKIASLEKLIQECNDTIILPWMFTWKSSFGLADTGRLSETGIKEHYDLGTRFASKFDSLLLPYNPNVVQFTSTYVHKNKMFKSQ